VRVDLDDGKIQVVRRGAARYLDSVQMKEAAMHPLDPVVTLSALSVGAGAAVALLVAARRVPQGRPALVPALVPALAGLAIWLGVAMGAARIGFFAAPDRLDMVGDALGFAAFGTLMTLPVAALVWARLRVPAFAALVGALPLGLLVGAQVFRLGGAVFAALAAEGAVPGWFGWTTAALDITVGALAVPLALWGGRRAMVGLSLLGLADFAHAIGYVGAAYAGLIAPDPAPAMIGLMPLALIALFQVPLAVALHLAVLERLGALSARRTTYVRAVRHP
jgi:hypothetical protein